MDRFYCQQQQRRQRKRHSSSGAFVSRAGAKMLMQHTKDRRAALHNAPQTLLGAGRRTHRFSAKEEARPQRRAARVCGRTEDGAMQMCEHARALPRRCSGSISPRFARLNDAAGIF